MASSMHDGKHFANSGIRAFPCSLPASHPRTPPSPVAHMHLSPASMASPTASHLECGQTHQGSHSTSASTSLTSTTRPTHASRSECLSALHATPQPASTHLRQGSAGRHRRPECMRCVGGVWGKNGCLSLSLKCEPQSCSAFLETGTCMTACVLCDCGRHEESVETVWTWYNTMGRQPYQAHTRASPLSSLQHDALLALPCASLPPFRSHPYPTAVCPISLPAPPPTCPTPAACLCTSQLKWPSTTSVPTP